MGDNDLSRTDRDVGAMLSGDEVEKLREAINWARSNRGLRFNDIARGCDVSEHTVRNFAYRKSIRPDNAFLGRVYKYLSGKTDILPMGFQPVAEDRAISPSEITYGRLARYDLIRMDMPIDEIDLNRVFDRYSGHYLCYRRSYRPSRISVSWLHIRPLNPNINWSQGNLPVPRFTLFIKYPDQFDSFTTRNYIIGGYAVTRNGRLFLFGHHDGELKLITLNEPSSRHFTYIEGLSLLTSADDKRPFSTRIVCQYLGLDVSRDPWEDRIGVFSDGEFDNLFENAKIVVRALGEGGVLTTADSH